MVVSASMWSSSTFAICAKSASVSKLRAVVAPCGWATGCEPRFGGRREAGRRPPHRAGDEQPRKRLVGFDDLDVVSDESEPVAEIDQPTTKPTAGLARKTSRTGSSRPPIPSG